jgi:hypothetical protein
MKVIVGYRAGPYSTRGLHRIESTVHSGHEDRSGQPAELDSEGGEAVPTPQ